ncbi:MAG TPA: SDR family oxidoreductase [Candidatus Latescibacteria bacterium]|nr:SDR family oxidoreductase [Candidatus Latescibacterota bacterium]
MRLRDRVAVITGSGRGIGAATAIRLAEEGAKIVVNDINEENANKVVDEIKSKGSDAVGVIVDITKMDNAKKLIDTGVEKFGQIDILVNNAGLNRDMLIKDMTEKDWDDVVDLDLKATFFCCKFASQYMVERKYGKIINISSRAWLGNPGQANYSAAKAGVIGLTKALCMELGRYNITVNAVAPGMIETDLLKSHPKYDQMVERALKNTPMRRVGQPREVANVILFLATDESSYVTGNIIYPSGGRF